MMYEKGIGFFLLVIIVTILFLITVLLVVTICRRAYNARKYKKLDKQRDMHHQKLIRYLETEHVPERMEELFARPKSIKWLAIENVLLELMDEEKYARKAKELFQRLDYRTFYERKTNSNNIIRKASAIDKLGKMRSEPSTGSLIPMLDVDNTEIVAVTARSLGRIGTPEGLEAILTRMPRLLSLALVTRKTIETALKNFGMTSITTLIEFGDKYIDPGPKASILEVLSNMGARESLPFAAANLDHADAEVRSKALKVIGAVGTELPEPVKKKVLARLDDTVWFVRLQAAKALGNLKYEKAEDALAVRLLDENWQVRNAAAMALTMLSDKALDIFLGILESTDEYAKESICEEIEKTNYVDRLIGNMDSLDLAIYHKSRNILMIMCSLNYSSPLTEYLKTGANERIKKKLELLVHEEPASCGHLR